MWFILLGIVIFVLGFYFIRIGVRKFKDNEFDFSRLKATWKFFESSNDFFIGFVFSLIGVLFVYGGLEIVELTTLS